jgi:Helix-turn-helix domain
MPLISAHKLADHLTVAPATIYDKVRKRQIPHFKIGDRLLFDLDDVLAAIRQPVETDKIEIPKFATSGRR